MSSAPSPFAIQRAMSAARDFADRLRADVGETDHDTLLSALDSETDAIDLLRKVVISALEDQAFAAASRERVQNLTARIHRFDNRYEAKRQLSLAMLDALGLPGLADPEFDLSRTPGSVSVVIVDENAIPELYKRTKSEPNKAALLPLLKSGVRVAGAELSNGKPSVTIRPK